MSNNESERATELRVAEIMRRHDARLLRIIPVHDAGDWVIKFYSVDGHVVVVQFWNGGGCSHYIPGDGSTWAQFELDIELLKCKPTEELKA